MNEDIRIYKTKIAIERALIELLQQHHFKDITIKKICDQALIGRSTFYSHYLDKYDLLEKNSMLLILKLKLSSVLIPRKMARWQTP
ncbi:TetR/AcrR family transcriptional regulator [Paenibacillus sp. CH40]|uniref:TetR/AcrR family transcriptional regulator n=1 Tax=Paenibacillus sp. CH40 TaxID=2962045 RepID=UPI0020B68C54|nr:TetR family transcriptional regulator [Paenibacillus sp. CH40]MCP3797234.1 TetR/AcrR family transcriptional regulator [Paenibacillus sp. CH40]